MGCDFKIKSATDNGEVSIHAPVWGATLAKAILAMKTGFNPRTRVGCDDNVAPKVGVTAVSIHAPVWGATHASITEGVCAMFQSTHPCGVRL